MVIRGMVYYCYNNIILVQYPTYTYTRDLLLQNRLLPSEWSPSEELLASANTAGCLSKDGHVDACWIGGVDRSERPGSRFFYGKCDRKTTSKRDIYIYIYMGISMKIRVRFFPRGPLQYSGDGTNEMNDLFHWDTSPQAGQKTWAFRSQVSMVLSV